MPLEPGDTVSVYTDGVTDALNAGRPRCSVPMKWTGTSSPEDANVVDAGRPKRLGERLVNAVRKHADGRPQNDDIAVVCFGRLEAETGPISGAIRKMRGLEAQVPALKIGMRRRSHDERARRCPKPKPKSNRTSRRAGSRRTTSSCSTTTTTPTST